MLLRPHCGVGPFEVQQGVRGVLDRFSFPPCCIAVEVGVVVLASRSCSAATPLAGGAPYSDLSWFVCWLVGRRHVCTHFGYHFLAEGGKFTAVDFWESQKCHKSKVVLGCVQWVN